MVFSPYGETVCFSVKPIGRVSTYIVSVDRNSKSVVIRVDWTLSKLTFLFFSRLCRLTQNICDLCTFLSSSCGSQTPPSIHGRHFPFLFCKDFEPVSAHFYICNGLIQRYKRFWLCAEHLYTTAYLWLFWNLQMTGMKAALNLWRYVHGAECACLRTTYVNLVPLFLFCWLQNTHPASLDSFSWMPRFMLRFLLLGACCFYSDIEWDRYLLPGCMLPCYFVSCDFPIKATLLPVFTS